MKQQNIWGMVLLSGCLTFSLATLGWSDEDERWGGKSKQDKNVWERTSDVPLVTNKNYQTECSACHFAYQPGFLPERSWKKIMGSLDDHFGENAELSDAMTQEIENFLVGRAADVIPNRFSRSILRSISAGETPLRISKTAYFERKHDEIPNRLVAGNPKVRSFSNCLNCHTT
ncbi:MAG: diacylglycerol kinase, partial [Zetaproteobacteria bacterium CG02_land_8_20_14_3_00_50_9]